METESSNDVELVERSRDGDREAFGRIVERYQSLVCALTYSACGNLQSSEDLAQVTFITAWCELPKLREPSKLKAWLCGMARNVTNNSFRQAQRTPTAKADVLNATSDVPTETTTPRDHAITKEEEAILWRALSELPPTYRAPLVLFYRQQQSTAEVADTLGLTEDAVHQRLSRGRAMLTEKVTRFVEGALQCTTPGKAFTVGVLAALPVLTTSAKAAVVGATAAKGSAVAKSTAWAAVLGPFAAFVSLYFGYKLDRESARSPQRREFVTKYYRILVVCIAVFILSVLLVTLGPWHLAESHPMTFVALLIGLGSTYMVVVGVLNLYMRRDRRRIREQEIAEGRPLASTPLFEYQSKSRLLGLPLVHIRIRGGLERGPVKAWIAGGDAAIGVIFAFGAVAIAPLSFGGLALGVLTLGGFALGVVPFDGFSFGPWALGAFAVGWQAYGAVAVGWSAAQGVAAVAHDFAVGIVAFARHANDPAAEAYFRNSSFYHNVLVVMRCVQWLNLLWLLPLALWWWTVLARRRKESGKL